ncbi:DUF2314 domain-containing protein [Pedobacter caeni]|uniref:Uncharacterized conserved protein YegJ, DUF2314 family n=1 Tax=Pedobacter caeni TaxID=288992 RepID=A0A1M4TMV6_9SPHI|nr:DUF2314 domain-containing protein [Pedobacter caeni]SHE45726.1 Uncharacterized conserved protein YegJ, DUF2314 family [Pedobacter caeni]
MADNLTFFSKADNPEMNNAFHKAQETFKYFWRELSWEHHRIVPALDLAFAKVAFMENVSYQTEPIVEHMWISEVDFDGYSISGVLVNDPIELSNVQNGDFVEVPLNQISDWLFTSGGKTYGGFTIQVLRSGMDNQERKEHDEAWGLDFGDYNDISIVYEQKQRPENLIEHPMSINMKESLAKFIKEQPAELSNQDDAGYTILHRETVAGNRTSVEVLLQLGADKNVKTAEGKSALDLAKQVGWEQIIPLLEN